jgi:hypothetical protein
MKADTSLDNLAAAARVASRLGVPAANLPVLLSAPALDAAPDFTGWAGPLVFQNLLGFAEKLPVETRGYLARDDRHIYMAIRCEDPAAKEIAVTPVPRDGEVWVGECVEFMLLPGYDPEQPYYHFVVNPAGSFYDAKGVDKSWDSGGKVFAAVDATGWLAVIRVPLEALGVNEGELPALWRVNLYRSRPARAGVPALSVAWSPTFFAQHHVPDRFGLVACDGGRALDAAAEAAILKRLTRKEEIELGDGIELGEPVIVAVAPANIRGWGAYQFPGMDRLPDGKIRISMQVEADSALSYGLPCLQAVSADEGKTWTVLPREQPGTGAAISAASPVVLPNGERLAMKMCRPLQVAGLRLPDSIGTSTLGCAYYRIEDLPPECRDGWRLWRYPAGGGAPTEEKAVVRLPGELRYVVEGVMPFPWWAGHRLLLAPDGAVWAFTEECRTVDGDFHAKPEITFLRSTDHGRSFDYWSAIPYNPDPVADPKAAKRTGFYEPCVNFMSDGSALCLLRTTEGLDVSPLYQCRSTDNGRTWSKPEIFDDLGVWPQMLTLKNGVTLAAYGRPGLYVRASADSAGRTWGRRATVVPPRAIHTDTCSYCALLALSDDTALIAYSNFNVPGPDGTMRKAILVRSVKAAPPPWTPPRSS